MNLKKHHQTHHHNKFPCQLDDGNLEACPYVVDFSYRPFLQDQQEGLHGVTDKQEVAGYRQSSLNGTAAGRRAGYLGLYRKVNSVGMTKPTISCLSAAKWETWE